MKFSAVGLALLASPAVYGLHIRAVGRRDPLRRRTSLAGASPLVDSADIQYYTNLTMGGQQFTVLIDTGSADLWVAGNVPGAISKGAQTSVQYAVGEVQGPVMSASMDFDGYTVSDQAYLQVTPDGTNPEGTGLIGLGPVGGSNVYAALKNDPKAAPPADRIFQQNTSAPNFLTVLLGRTDDPLNIFNGDLTLGTTLSNYSDITNQPKTDVSIVTPSDAGDQHFALLLDTDGFYGPDNKSISITTQVSQTKNKNQATAILDTGFSLSQVPKSVADAIYSRVSGAEFTNVTGVGATWIVPCTQEVNLTVKVNGIRYPIHPLDTTLDPSVLGMSSIQNSQGEASCIGLFQPISFDTGTSPDYDVILGMSFLRNVYVLFNYGDFIAGSTTNRGDPFIQFLGTTDPAKAHSDFVQTRLQGVDTTGNQVLSAATPTPTPSSSNSNSSWKPPTTWLIVGAVALGVGLLIVIVSVILCSRRRKNVRQATGAAWGRYRPVDSPFQAPLNGQMHDPNATPMSYNPAQGQAVYDTHTYERYGNYQEPWDHRY